MTVLPGVNFAHKPYIDDGGPLPSVGDRVVWLPFCGSVHIEGTVLAVDASGRRVHVEGFKQHRHPTPRREDMTWWARAQDVEVIP